VALIGVAFLFAAGALFIKYKLEGVRAVVQHAVAARTGADVQVGAVLVNGLRGLRIDEAQLNCELPGGALLDIRIPIAYVNVDIADLLYGQVTVQQVQADDSVIHVKRPEHAKWFSSEGLKAQEISSLMEAQAFRLIGSNASLEIENVLGDSKLDVKNLSFDLSRLTGSPDLAARLSGQLPQGTAQDFKIDIRFASMEDFDLRFQCSQVNQQDLATLLPAAGDLVHSGVINPSVRVAGYPGNTMVVAFEAPFDNLTVKNQPGFIEPVAGTVTGVAAYNTKEQVLSLTAARVTTGQFDGAVDGSIAFHGEQPVLDLHCQITRVPMTDVLEYTVADRPAKYGSFNLHLAEPYEMRVAVSGSIETPRVSVEGKAAGGDVIFLPDNQRYPRGTLTFGPMALSWDSESDTAAGVFPVVDGQLIHDDTHLQAEDVSGAISLENQSITVKSLSATVGGHVMAGWLEYDLTDGQLKSAVSGTIPAIEGFGFAKTGDLSMRGPVTVRATVERTPEKCVVDGELDMTQTDLAGSWWFRKQAGTGVTIKKMHAEIVPGKTVALKGNANLAGSTFTADLKFACAKGKWGLTQVEAKSDSINIASLGNCLHIPYTLTGGRGTDATLTLKKGDGKAWNLTSALDIDEASVQVDGGEAPMKFSGVKLNVELNSSDTRAGKMVLAARKANMPPIKGKWFASKEQYAQYREGQGGENRNWTFVLEGEDVEVPPWKGSQFKGEAFSGSNLAGFRSFSATIDGGGQLDGKYSYSSLDSVYTLLLDWNQIPSSYLIEQLQYPRVLQGTTTGRLDYTVDRDDPSTLQGTADFEITKGIFSADYLISRLEGKLENQISSLPLSLGFDSLKAKVDFKGDRVTTSDIVLASQGINVTGDGSFVVHGDMDYNVRVALSPKVAEKIPAIRDNLNVQGHKLAQQPIELAFRLQGPTFNPRGQITDSPPVGITIVSSALEVTSDAMRLIDIPRKVLVDLLRIGGGIVGISK